MKNHLVAWLLIVGVMLAATKGCESDDERVARLAQEAATRQGEQNHEMARLVESQQALQQGLNAQRGQLDQQRTVFEDEPRAIARARGRDPTRLRSPRTVRRRHQNGQRRSSQALPRRRRISIKSDWTAVLDFSKNPQSARFTCCIFRAMASACR
jgi:hypothetical protein